MVSFCGKAKRKSLAELLKQLLYLKQKQYLKGWNMLLIDGWIVMTAAVSASVTAYSTCKQVHAQLFLALSHAT